MRLALRALLGITMTSIIIAAVLSLAPPPPQCCPSCGLELQPKKYKGHLAFCAPDLLDPEGWANGDQETVLRQIRAIHRKGSPQSRALHLRFGPDGLSSQHEVAQHMGWTTRKTRDTIASLLHSIPPVADVEEPLEVLFEDEHMLAVNKPAAVPITPVHRWRGGSLLNHACGHLHLGPRDADLAPRPCHRLDLETSGVVIFAKTAKAARALMTQFEERTVRKTYAALCVARPTATEIDASICKVPEATHAVRRVCDAGESGGQIARSTLTVIGTAEESAPAAPAADDVDDSSSPDADDDGTAACLVLVHPEHGRTHQIRVHCSRLGAPLVGDPLYGGGADGPSASLAKQASLERHALHALALECRHPVTGRTLDIRAPLPRDMRRAMSLLGVRAASGATGAPGHGTARDEEAPPEARAAPAERKGRRER